MIEQKKKLRLEDIVVESFITDNPNINQATINGGSMMGCVTIVIDKLPPVTVSDWMIRGDDGFWFCW